MKYVFVGLGITLSIAAFVLLLYFKNSNIVSLFLGLMILLHGLSLIVQKNIINQELLYMILGIISITAGLLISGYSIIEMLQ